MRKTFVVAFIFFGLLTALTFWKFFIYGHIPFPGDYVRAWYEPWKTDTLREGVLGIAHKPVADDVFRHLYPLRVLAVDLLKKLQLPLWNPYNGGGTPLLAIMHPGYLNPFGFVFFIFSPEIAWAIFVALQPLLLGFCAYLYARKIKLSQEASLLIGTVLVFSGFVITRVLYGEFIYLLAGLFIFLLLIEDVLTHSKSKLWLLVAPLTGLLFLSGQPHMILYALLFAGCYGVYRYIQLKPAKYTHRIVLFLFLILLGIGMGGIQLIPGLELLVRSTINRASSEFIFQRFLLPFTHLITIVIPNYFGNQATYNWWGAGDYIETIASVGLIPLFFAYVALIQKKSQEDPRGFFLGSAIVTILLTLNWPATRWLYSLPIPVLSADVPSRIFVVTTVSIAVLSGYGFDAWQKKSLKFSKIIWFIAFVGTITIGTAGLAYFRPTCPVVEIPNCWSIALRNTVLEVGAFAGLMVGLFVFRKAKWIPIVLVIGLGLYNSNKFLPFSAKDNILPDNALIKALKENTRDARVFGFGSANLKTNFATHFRIYDPNYYDPLHVKRYAEFIGYANSGEYPPKLLRSDVELVTDVNLNGEARSRRTRALELLSAKYHVFKKSDAPYNGEYGSLVWEDNNWYITWPPFILPRVQLVQEFEIIGSGEKALQRLFEPRLSPSSTIILETHPQKDIKPTQLLGAAAIKEYGEQFVRIEVEASDPALLLLTDTYYPGWKAYIDDKETLIYRANYTFRAVEVPAGKHTIRFSYEPLSVKIGGWITIGSLVIYIVIVLLRVLPRATMQKKAVRI